MHPTHINSTKLIYGLVDYGEGARAVILHRSEAEEIYAALKAARQASTWGEFRQLCPEEYVELVHKNYPSKKNNSLTTPNSSRVTKYLLQTTTGHGMRVDCTGRVYQKNL